MTKSKNRSKPKSKDKIRRAVDVPDEFCRFVKNRAKYVGITQRKLALLSDLDPATLYRILNQKQKIPSNKILQKMAFHLRINPAGWLMMLAGRVPPKELIAMLALYEMKHYVIDVYRKRRKTK
jgi:transcriptional regulator with XRE-family HTH domain